MAKQFLNRRGKGIINLGSLGYGLDQACLIFEKVSSIYNDQFKTKYIILGLYCDMYRRLLNYYILIISRSYERSRFMFKPIYIKSKNTFKLIAKLSKFKMKDKLFD